MSDKGGSGGRTGRAVVWTTAPVPVAAPAPEPPTSPASYKEFAQEPYGSSEAANYGKQISGGWEASLSAPERLAVHNYKQSSTVINGRLRRDAPLTGTDARTQEWLDTALDRARIPDDIAVYRGVTGSVVDNVFRGRDVIADKGYMSTSGSTYIAKDFGGHKHGGYLIKINVKKGSRGMYIDADPKGSRPLDGEYEFLFPRNSRLRIRRYDEVNRIIEADLEQ